LLRTDIDEHELLAVDASHSVDGGIVKGMGAGARLGQGLDVVAGVAERAVDHAGDERYLADWLPVHGSGRRHAAFPVDQAEALQDSYARYGTYLLSQAFPEGSPTHPAYLTGHGTVARACITVLKFFYDGNAPFTHAVVPSNDGLSLLPYNGSGPLTVNGELHKLAHNISRSATVSTPGSIGAAIRCT
jgi:hypothetical protein